tara:strand:+ start:1844 stop:2335 length:492 start_codon:yes stop_codon:yes gene_type:complete
MHIIIQKRILTFNDYKVKCAVGKRGIGFKKKEGDLITPRGKYKINCIFYRNDRIKGLKTRLKKIVIKKNMGWCDDPKAKKYNKLVKLPYKFKVEKLHKTNNTYDIIFVLDYNSKPVRKNKGSAIFIHVAKKNFKSTEGCVAIKKKYLKDIASKVDNKTLVKIY